MSDTDRARLAALRQSPRIVLLWQALSALRTSVHFMQSGAHPDDETSAMLAALRFRDGVAVSYVCSTRGEGGQNDIGPETVRDLGVIRTAEMERAAEVLDMRQFWLGETPDDPVFDFGFSKSGEETIGIWGRERTLARFVQVVRAAKPDILCPTFLDVGGQHGHHRAMTRAAWEVFDLAADPAYGGSDLPPWEISKLYLPGWGGGGGSYDDDEPPPPATVTVPGKGGDPVTGWSWENLAQVSRAFHRTQGMGRWIAAGDERDWPLHLARSRVGDDRDAVTDNLPLTLTDIGLDAAQGALDAARAAFPDVGRVAERAAEALDLLDGDVPEAHAHRVARKRQELARVLRLAAGVEVRGRLSATGLLPGDRTKLALEAQPGTAEGLEVALVAPEGWSADPDGLTAGAGAPYPVDYDPLAPAAPALALRFEVAGVAVRDRVALDAAPVLHAPVAAALKPAAVVMNLSAPQGALTVGVSGLRLVGATPALTLPDGWRQDRTPDGLVLTAPDGLKPGLVEAALTLDGRPAEVETSLTYPHIPARLRTAPAVLRLRVLDAALPEVTVGYVGSGNDRVGHWLRAMGLKVEDLTDARLASEAAFDGLGAVVVGVFAFRRAALDAAVSRLHRWIAAGGTLATLYHRPGDNWQPDRTPPKRIEIGSPSLRWRVTDETAAVTHLAPDHPVLTGPNPIGPDDWAGWKKERGLYFARGWDEAYVPLVEMADPGEAPHRGALLSASIGKGRHSHVALGLHHQMNELVPGAFRLMANLVAPAQPG